MKKFIANPRRKLLNRRINREIYHKIFQHLNGWGTHGYPFNSDDEIVKMNMEAFLTTGSMVRLIERAASKMPKSEGEAFRHIAYRDLQKRMWMYVHFAEERMQPDGCDPCFVATRETA